MRAFCGSLSNTYIQYYTFRVTTLKRSCLEMWELVFHKDLFRGYYYFCFTIKIWQLHQMFYTHYVLQKINKWLKIISEHEKKEQQQKLFLFKITEKMELSCLAKNYYVLKERGLRWWVLLVFSEKKIKLGKNRYVKKTKIKRRATKKRRQQKLVKNLVNMTENEIGILGDWKINSLYNNHRRI